MPLHDRSRRQQLPEEVASYVREMIISGDVRAGDFLRIERIAEAVGVSTRPVREGLLTLRSEGFVELVPRRGLVVALAEKAVRYELVCSVTAPTDAVDVLAVVHGFRVPVAHYPVGVVAERTVSFEPARDSLGRLGALALGGRQHGLDDQIVDRPTIDAGQLRDVGAGRRILAVGKMRVDARP